MESTYLNTRAIQSLSVLGSLTSENCHVTPVFNKFGHLTSQEFAFILYEIFIHWIREWMGSRPNLDTVMKKRISDTTGSLTLSQN
jgi:hypothetical protein